MRTRSSQRRLPPPIVFVGLGLILFVTVPKVAPLLQIWKSSDLRSALSSPSSTQSPKLEDRLSMGEKLLITTGATAAKREGVEAFARHDYARAVKSFQQSLVQQPNDPEALIYLNNAQIGNSSPLKIAVSIPIGTNINVAQEILRGVAQAQHEVNQQGGLKGQGLQVQIANDDNNPEIARQVAQALAGNGNILAVVGHNASNASLAAAPVYQQAGLVMVTPTSFANLLSNFGSYIFRTVPNIRSMAAPLAAYIVQEKRLKTIAICYDSLSPDTASFRDEFVATLVRLGGQQADTICDFAAPSFNPALAMNEIRGSQADVVLLAPHIDRINQAIALAQANQSGLPLYGTTTLYTIQTLQQGGQAINGLVLPVPWLPTEPFTSNARQLWKGSVNWRTASAYDATQAVIAGLQQNTSRNGLQAVLRDPSFSAVGASGKVQFLATGDRIGEIILAKAVVNRRSAGFSRLQP
ncbi:MAG: ABC transporter substrate-binding protein [Cyanobacteria bacterium REEB459]|nr:ABC transporter substrate-binding protein [Cyanobacteria bacterium REEB459]